MGQTSGHGEAVALVAAALSRAAPAEILRDRLRGEPTLTPTVIAELLKRSSLELRQQPREAGHLASIAAKLAAEADLLAERVSALRLLAQASLVTADFERALEALDEAAVLARAEGDEGCVAGLDAYRVTALLHLERHDEAREAARRTIAVFERLGRKDGLLRAHVALADVESRLDRPRVALQHYARAEELLPADPPPRLRAAIAANRANALQACNRFRASHRQAEIARDIFVAEGCDHTVAQIDLNSAHREFLRGRYRVALRRYDVAEQAFRRLDDARHLAQVQLDRAEIHLHLNLPKEADGLAISAEEHFRALGLGKECAQAAHVRGRAAEMQGCAAEAVAAYERARSGFARLGLLEREIGCIVQCALIALDEKRTAEAGRLEREASARLRDTMNPLTRATVELLRTRMELALGNCARARGRAERTLVTLQRAHAPWMRIEAWRILGCAHRELGEFEAARTACRRAIEELEQYRGGVPPDEYMTAFLGARAGLYEEAVDLALLTGDVEDAYAWCERAKSRALADLLARPDRAADDLAPDREQCPRVRVLRERLLATYQRIFQAVRDADALPDVVLGRLRSRANEMEHELARLQRMEHRRRGDSSASRTFTPPGLESIQSDLEPGTCLVEYFVAKDWLAAFVVTREEIHAARRQVASDDVRRALEHFAFHMMRFQRPHPPNEVQALKATRSNLETLSDLLLEPVRPFLEGERLVVVPHGVLHHLPFHALPWGKGWLADHFETVIHAPSATVYGQCARGGPVASGPACVLGLPSTTAPRIADEVHRVAAHLKNAHVVVGAEATLARLRDCARDASVLHIASHGMFRPGEPLLSSIQLADGWASFYDLQDLSVHGELVVLSTCESGIADVTEADELLGLSRAFLYAGARTLLTSQWRIHDEATADFMDAFYGALERYGDVGLAHSEAMHAVRSKHPHPYYWAAFHLMGRPVARGPAPPGDTEFTRRRQPKAAASTAEATVHEDSSR